MMKSNEYTREQFIAEIRKRVPSETPQGSSFAAQGARMKMYRAYNLLNALERGETPSTRQVVGYFGKGARFVP